ncbi:probable pectinesterase/pectinesterase inhibitor 60 isoform X2 [Jatropha curcas]|uniref:probable pectinesterase/pectinesterase inhibitor 60 isoform X2 n=1 Tax=Jatropha curcas TaxID=180498 RepID=UPI0009D63F5E|nr:probable pectinesterase/pectinesterase inhibitor 60 isoform X2 [Jatropha curcas]
MAIKVMPLTIFFFFFILSSIFSIAASKSSKSNLTWWCNKTPYPEPCNYFMNRRQHRHSALKHRSEFRKIMVEIALERSLTAQRKVFKLRPKCQNHQQRAVWADCYKLHADTILQLNRTLQGLQSKKKKSCTNFDAQTWLSTALTNIEDNNYTQGFPKWIAMNERRLLQSSSVAAKANLVVAQDGSGNFRSIQAAINVAAKRRYKTRFIIHVKRGVYRENIEVGVNNNNIWLIGDGMRNTIITSSRSVGAGYTTYSSATAGIDGLRFVARGITFSNTAGPLKGQAVALRSASDLSVFYRCSFQGYQDTLFVHSQRQFYKECYIYGTIDFIFGNAAVVFQNCIIYVRKPLKGQANMITAQGRNDPYQNTGISIHNSQILPAPDLKPVVRSFQTYLGRPWMQYSRTVILKTYIDGFINPAGWSKWLDSDFALDTLYFAEYKNSGPGSSTRQRVKWKGYHVITSNIVASSFTVARLIAGQSWLPGTGVPFISGL